MNNIQTYLKEREAWLKKYFSVMPNSEVAKFNRETLQNCLKLIREEIGSIKTLTKDIPVEEWETLRYSHEQMMAFATAYLMQINKVFQSLEEELNNKESK